MGHSFFSRGLFYLAVAGLSASTVVLAVGLSIGNAQVGAPAPVKNGLENPPICSAKTAALGELKGICEVAPLGNGRDTVKVNLTAQTSQIEVGGYNVTTEHYNESYVPPVVEAMPGDTVAAHLVNELGKPIAPPNAAHSMGHGDPNENATNLHYFHGGIVTPRNDRSEDSAASLDAGLCHPKDGCGDNVYVRLKNGKNSNAGRADYSVPIPGKGKLDAGVLEKVGYIEHPSGLNWFHSHQHGISSDQVMGGLSGLLSVGLGDANVRAKCKAKPNPTEQAKCDENTEKLKKRTFVRYALLRDIPLKGISALPNDPDGATPKTATWEPEKRDFLEGEACDVYVRPAAGAPPTLKSDKSLREGYCQRDEGSAWLFTLNGQRFPTIKVEENQNLVLRLGNLSSNVAYWLELYNKKTGAVRPISILSVDGVVPGKPIDPSDPGIPIDAFDVNDLLLMPASRVEFYVRNDSPRLEDEVYILRTKGLNAGTDQWPEIQLARIELKASKGAEAIELALNSLVTIVPSALFSEQAPAAPKPLPKGCIRDLRPDAKEHRRVTFEGSDGDWRISTEIVHPPKNASTAQPAEKFEISEDTALSSVPFTKYELEDGSIDWQGTRERHVCVELNGAGSRKQLWVLVNNTGALHNFHIHQMKFRLATRAELVGYGVEAPTYSETCPDKTCKEPSFKFFEEGTSEEPVWHDTIPIPPLSDDRPEPPMVFVIMSFTAEQQAGRFVYHCHILKHEDKGLMAPIEVWKP